MVYPSFLSFGHVDAVQAVIGVLLGALIAFFSYHFKFLSLGGSVATFLLATIIYGIGGWVWAVPVLTFFISSSLLSKVGKEKKKKFEPVFDKTDKRDEGQVAANGGVAGILALCWYIVPEYSEMYLLYVASLAAVTADTWATEIGTLGKRKPISITSFKKVEPGTSGGVSLIGLLGGLLGASLVTFSGWAVNSELFSVDTLIKLLVASTAGSLSDSLLGATFQAQYQTKEGTLTEKAVHNRNPTALIRGVRWIDNDTVNCCCAISGVVTMYFLL